MRCHSPVTSLAMTTSESWRDSWSSLGAQFSRLWAAAAVSNFGDGLVLVALPLLVESMTSNAIYVSGLITMRYAAWLLLGLVGGVTADRADRQRIMVYVDLARTVAIGTLGVVIVFGTPPIALIWAVAFLLGCGEVFFDSAAEAMLPNVVEEAQLERANSRLFVTQSVANEFIGPPVGAFLFAIAAALPFLLDAWSFLGAAMIVLTLRGRFSPAPVAPDDLATTSPRAAAAFRSDVAAGWRFVRGHRLLRSLIGLGCAWNFFAVGAESTLVVFARRELHTSEAGYGLALTGFAVGGILAGWLTERIVAKIGPGRTILATFLLGAIAGFATATTHSIWVLAFAFACSFAAGTAASIVVLSLRQQLVPDELRGRVASLFRVGVFASAGTGALLMGILANRVSLRAPFYALGLAAIALFLGAATEITNTTIAAAKASRGPADNTAVIDGSGD